MLREVLDVLTLLDSPRADGARVAAALVEAAGDLTPEVETVSGNEGSTDFMRVVVPGAHGKRQGGDAPTLGIIGRHGGSGARPQRIGFVSDGDGAAAALAAALKLARMRAEGDSLQGDVIITTHVCPDAPTTPHTPVEFMGSPVDTATMNRLEVHEEMDAVISIDTTKGNRILNHRGIAITPTVVRGWIMRVGDELVSLAERVTGEPAAVLPLSMGDITPYGNGAYHVNSILQPATATVAPVVGLAITAVTTVPGSATGASHETDIALAARFALEAAKEFTGGRLSFYEPEQLARLVELYGEMTHLQGTGRTGESG
jgi:hypothetical protein